MSDQPSESSKPAYHVRNASAKVFQAVKIRERVAAHAAEECTEMNVQFTHIAWQRSADKVFVNLQCEIRFVAENYDFMPDEIVECMMLR